MPDHLRQALTDWAIGAFFDLNNLAGQRYPEVAIHMRAKQRPSGVGWWMEKCKSGTFVLDLIQALLELYGYDGRRSHDLESILVRGNSMYTVAESARSLETRVEDGVRESVSEAIDSAGGSAGDHLVLAWNAAYGREPDPVRSFSESIKAVEYALATHVSPTNERQTLGTMIRDIKAKPSKWSFVIEGKGSRSIDTLLGMMETLWDGQTSRHGSSSSRNETPEEARAAIHLAAALVQFGATGAFCIVASSTR